MTAKVTSPALHYHGAKFRLANWIMQFFPPHRIYVEPFGGAAGVLLQKERSYVEVYNDLDEQIVNFFRVLRDHDQCQRLIDALVLTPYSREEFVRAYKKSGDSVENARRTVVRSWMGFGSVGATQGITGFRIDCNRSSATAQHLWQQYPDSLVLIGKRLQGY